MGIVVDVIRDFESAELPTDEQLESWANLAAADRKPGAELCIRIVDATESQQLNADYRGKDKPTNVLSFPFEAPPGLPVNILGDLAICAEVVAHEAEQQNKQLAHHWAHMVI